MVMRMGCQLPDMVENLGINNNNSYLKSNIKCI